MLTALPDVQFGSELIVSVNNGDGSFTSSVVSGSRGTTPSAVRDVNGDGKPDIEVTTAGGLVPLYGDGAGNFTAGPVEDSDTQCPQLAPGLTPRGDFDGDGQIDCVFFQAGQSAGLVDVVFRQGLGQGRYRTAQVVTSGIALDSSASPYAAADLNGDGRDDLVMGISNGTAWDLTTVILSGRADGTFVAAPAVSFSYLPSASGLQNSYLADFDGDGRKDLFTAGAEDLTVTGALCLGTISMTGSSAAPSARESCTAILGAPSDYAVTAVDVNHDGKLDVVLVSDTLPDYGLVVALGDGAGRFTLAPSSLPSGIVGTDGASAATPVDCDGDGKIDLVVTFGNSPTPRPPAIFYGDGAGGFAADAAQVSDAGVPADGDANWLFDRDRLGRIAR